MAFYIWSATYDPYSGQNMSELQRNYREALSDPLKSEDKLLQTLLITSVTTNIQLYPNDPQYYFERANHYAAQARQDLAIPDYTQAIELAPENVFYYWERGRAYWVLSHYEKSVDDYNRAIKLEIPQGVKRKVKTTLVSYELDQLREEQKELLESFN